MCAMVSWCWGQLRKAAKDTNPRACLVRVRGSGFDQQGSHNPCGFVLASQGHYIFLGGVSFTTASDVLLILGPTRSTEPRLRLLTVVRDGLHGALPRCAWVCSTTKLMVKAQSQVPHSSEVAPSG